MFIGTGPEEWNDLEDETFHDKCEQIECLIDIADWFVNERAWCAVKKGRCIMMDGLVFFVRNTSNKMMNIRGLERELCFVWD